MFSCFDETLSKYQNSAQQNLLALLEKWKTAVGKGNVLGAFLTDLSNAFDCLNHERFMAKLRAYEFILPA